MVKKAEIYMANMALKQVVVENMRSRREGGQRLKNVRRRGLPGKPLVSVITVVFNGAATVEDTINSVLQQSYDNIEFIVVDGGSRDGTQNIIEKYDSEIGYWLSEPDAGIYDAMNKGLALASGEIVGFLNSDDFYADSSVLDQVVKEFQDRTIDACHADLVYVSQDNRRVVRYWRSKCFTKGDFALGWCPAHPTFYVRRSVVEQYGSFDKSFRLAADAELMMRYLERGAIRSTYVSRVWVRMRVGGQTNQSLSNIFQQNKEIFGALKKNGVPYSKFLFVTRKVISRVWQVIFGRIRRYH